MEHCKKSLMLTLYIDRIALALWVVTIFSIPIIARWYDMYSNKESIFIQFVVIVYIAMVPAFVILFLLNTLLTNIRRGNIFVGKNVFALKVISYCCFVIAALSLIMTVWRLLALVIFAAFAFVGLLLRVLKNVFEQAVILREESDFTV